MSAKTLVIGASLKPERYSNMVIHNLVDKSMETVAHGSKKGSVANISIDTELKNYKHIDTVTLYLNPKRQPDFYDYIVGLHPRRVIFNPGTENVEFQNLLKENGIETEVACSLVLLSTNQY